MYSLKNNYDNRNADDIEDVYHLLKKNADTTKTLIQHIDALIESKHFPESILKILISIRNACAINVMNIARFTK